MLETIWQLSFNILNTLICSMLIVTSHQMLIYQLRFMNIDFMNIHPLYDYYVVLHVSFHFYSYSQAWPGFCQSKIDQAKDFQFNLATMCIADVAISSADVKSFIMFFSVSGRILRHCSKNNTEIAYFCPFLNRLSSDVNDEKLHY